MAVQIDKNIADAIRAWIQYGICPGSCTWYLLKGDYVEAKKHAHPLILPYWDGHIAYVEALPAQYRGQCMKGWKQHMNV